MTPAESALVSALSTAVVVLAGVVEAGRRGKWYGQTAYREMKADRDRYRDMAEEALGITQQTLAPRKPRKPRKRR